MHHFVKDKFLKMYSIQLPDSMKVLPYPSDFAPGQLIFANILMIWRILPIALPD